MPENGSLSLAMDHFELRVEANPESEPTPVQIVINGDPLLDTVRRLEEPFVAAETRERLSQGESEAELSGFIAGDYAYPTQSIMSEGDRDFFGVIDSIFRLDSQESMRGKVCVLECNCGNPGCWPLLVRISELADEVVWADFEQFHRDWEYDLGPFRFDRAKYEEELQRVATCLAPHRSSQPME